MPTLVELLENLLVFLEEEPAGDIDSSNTVFTLSQSPLGLSTQVFLDGVHLIPAGDSTPNSDYDITDRTITLNTPPLAGSNLTVKYVIAAMVDLSSQFVWNENPGDGDGSTTQFYVASPPIVNSNLDVFVDGSRQILNVDFDLAETQDSVIFNTAPFAGSSISINYRFPITGTIA